MERCSLDASTLMEPLVSFILKTGATLPPLESPPGEAVHAQSIGDYTSTLVTSMHQKQNKLLVNTTGGQI